MKYYSEITGKFYDSENDCKNAEAAASKEKETNEAKYLNEIQDAKARLAKEEQRLQTLENNLRLAEEEIKKIEQQRQEAYLHTQHLHIKRNSCLENIDVLKDKIDSMSNRREEQADVMKDELYQFLQFLSSL